ncbi:nicotinate-nucleotide pyrophosphorylase [Liquorilactobacillus aquaticus DSM 21051]|uniref:nicotinate-nucleotide diphosphorylase (carboxylating) n=1 Tax=Liquorilactobacillus aquaticus DSM 21051 TaxID=1423725 RepID=A0A0R2DAB5_9LACO|nr:carboxylating nicotinate-nucleotide diphosphorylase [Liquorilactobacillus aquaticus]KRM97075.1 nicotinate-nucleotide pyrophosphorylase [Liquorilactobacillus aquaticus DSM 21051]
MNHLLAKNKIEEFLLEDLSFGDASDFFFKSEKVSGSLVAKKSGVVCGQEIPYIVFEILGNVEYQARVSEGKNVAAGTVIGRFSGLAKNVLAGERVILNLMQRMSGIATATHTAIQKLEDPAIKITDTRKTAPGLRYFDKYAVKVGGGQNHRFDLCAGLMLKDNHLAAKGGIKNALTLVTENIGPMTKVEVEIETKEQLEVAIKSHIDAIMFDNQKPEVIKKWIKIVPTHITTEASGGINFENIAYYKGCGVDFISLGCLTNEVKPLDISLVLDGVIKA